VVVVVILLAIIIAHILSTGGKENFCKKSRINETTPLHYVAYRDDFKNTYNVTAIKVSEIKFKVCNNDT